MNLAWAVALGGALGSVARYWTANAVYAWLGRDFPYGTLAVNVLGGVVMGVLTELLVRRYAVALEWRALCLVGFLGGFTTFSTFSLETWLLLQEHDWLKAGHYVLASVVLCVAAVGLGLWITQTLWDGVARVYDLTLHGLLSVGVLYALGVLIALAAARGLFSASVQTALLLMIAVLVSTAMAVWTLRETPALGAVLWAFIGAAAVSGALLWLGDYSVRWVR